MKLNRAAALAAVTVALAALAQPASAVQVPVTEQFEAGDDFAASTTDAAQDLSDAPVAHLAIGPTSVDSRWLPRLTGFAGPTRLGSSASAGPAGGHSSGPGSSASDRVPSQLSSDLGFRFGREAESEADFDSDHDRGRDRDRDHDHGGPSAVPVPSAAWLLGSALVLFTLRRRGRLEG